MTEVVLEKPKVKRRIKVRTLKNEIVNISPQKMYLKKKKKYVAGPMAGKTYQYYIGEHIDPIEKIYGDLGIKEFEISEYAANDIKKDFPEIEIIGE